eukprot:GILK01002554.1.p1 GENE.GILK01002554.1~~GILK01002554.1.p1  ORF type:complete len:427 (+),score=55.47 GILK01002554.1:78-1358(+)
MDRLCLKASCWIQAAIAHVLDIIWRRILRVDRSRLVFSAEWLTDMLRKNGAIPNSCTVTQAATAPLNENRGFCGDMTRITLTFSEQVPELCPRTLVVKRLFANSLSTKFTNIMSTWCREALFYARFQSHVSNLPRVYHAAGSTFSGDSTVVMEDLGSNSTGVNFFFGNQIWGMEPLKTPRTPEDMLRDMFETAAIQHAKFWRDPSLLELDWLKNSAFYKGRNKALWTLAMERGRRDWNAVLKEIAAGDTGVRWSEKLIAIFNKSYAHSSWETLQAHLQDKTIPFTLTHGDFHAANMFWYNAGQGIERLRLVDWSEVGPWEPTMDLSQTVISDVKRDVWRTHDRRLVKHYYDTLIKHGVSADEYTFDQCWERYQRAGVEKWIWMFSIMARFAMPAIAKQYFHDQILSFIEDHGDLDCYILKPIICMI